MSYIKSQIMSKRSQVNSVLTQSGASGSLSLDLGSFGSQESVHFDELEVLQLAGEGSFGKVSVREQPDCRNGGGMAAGGLAQAW